MLLGDKKVFAAGGPSMFGFGDVSGFEGFVGLKGCRSQARKGLVRGCELVGMWAAPTSKLVISNT